jgi:hypothetical protein
LGWRIVKVFEAPRAPGAIKGAQNASFSFFFPFIFEIVKINSYLSSKNPPQAAGTNSM